MFVKKKTYKLRALRITIVQGDCYLLINASINHSKYRMSLFLEFILLALLHSVSHSLKLE